MSRFVAGRKRTPTAHQEGIFQLPLDEFVITASPHLSRPTHLHTILDMFRRIDAGEAKVRGVYAAPCQVGKSTTVQHGIAWLMGRHPDWPIIFATYSQQFSAKNSRAIRDIYMSCGGPIQDDFNTIQEWHTGEGGLLLATSPDGPGTGTPARCFFFDDLIKDREEAENAARREHIKDWIKSVAFTRQGPLTAYNIIASRFHTDDPSGWLLNEKHWPEYRLAALNDDGEDPLRELGESLCPGGPDPEAPRTREFFLACKEDVGPYDFESLYQGRPTAPDGAIFKEVAYIDALGKGQVSHYAWGLDLAYTDGGNSDTTALTLLAQLIDGREAVVYHRTWQKSLEDSGRILLDELLKNPYPISTYISGNENGHIETLARDGVRVEAKHARYGKALRAQGTSRAWNAGRIVVLSGQPWTPKFVGRIRGFTGNAGGKDDEADSLVAAHDRLTGGGFGAPRSFKLGINARM